MTNTPAELLPVELLPCPFCGGSASDTGHVHYSKPLTDTWWNDGSAVTEAFSVNCMSCGAVSRGGVIGGYKTKDEAIAAWNTRATQPIAPQIESELRKVDESELRKAVDAALDRMKRAADRGTGCHLTADMVGALSVTIVGQAWNDPVTLTSGADQ